MWVLISLHLTVSTFIFSYSYSLQNVRVLFAFPLSAVINIVLVWYGVNAWRINRKYSPPMMQLTMSIFLIWSVLLIIRSFELSETRIRDLIFTNWGAMSLFMVFFAAFGLRKKIWVYLLMYNQYILKIGIVIVSINIVVMVLNAGQQITIPITHTILFFAPLYFLSGFHINKKFISLGFVGLVVWFFMAFFIDRREDMVLILWYFFCSLPEMKRSVFFTQRIKLKIFSATAIFIIIFLMLGLQNIYNIVETDALNSRIELFFDEGGISRDTRAGLVEDFFDNRTMTELVIGGGAVTTYNTSIYNISQSYLSGYQRTHIEIGHLYHTLTGGFILNALFLVLALGAIFLGYFRSNNKFTRALSYIIAGWVLMMLTAATPLGGLRYALVWLAIGGCWSRELRVLTTDEFIACIRDVGNSSKRRKIVLGW